VKEAFQNATAIGTESYDLEHRPKRRQIDRVLSSLFRLNWKPMNLVALIPNANHAHQVLRHPLNRVQHWKPLDQIIEGKNQPC